MNAQICALSASLLVAAPTMVSAQAQPGSTLETGTLITRRLAQVRGETTVGARRTLREFSTCVAAKHPGLAEDLIDRAVDTKPYQQTMYALVDEDCFSSGEMTIPQELMRGGVFEALYLREFSQEPKADLQKAASYDYSAPYSKPLSEDAQNAIGLAIVGDCVTRTAPAVAHSLLLSDPGSPPEDRAIGELAKILPGCVPPNKTFHFSRSIIRGSVAEALLRLRRVTRQQASASK